MKQANRALRANFDYKLSQVKSRSRAGTRMMAGSKNVVSASQDMCYGRANRPQTPVTGIINQEYGADAEMETLDKYEQWKQSVS